jgi:sugar/nucleoside kinase (ribokinase family)
MKDKIIVSGVGCCLVDLLYNQIDFSSPQIRPFLSRSSGDGGLSPGKLVLLEDFERFSHMPLDDFMHAILHDPEVDKINIGGPSIVSLIHAAQVAGLQNCEFRFYGKAGKDIHGKYLRENLARTPVVLKHFSLTDKRTPSTIVLSDPGYDNGHGERMFINAIGAAWDMHPEDLDADFFESDVVVFGGTAIVPGIHDHLTSLTRKAKDQGCVTVINTVYDFRNEKFKPGQSWPLGETDETYRNTDILITDKEEALRLSGRNRLEAALEFFMKKGTRTAIITNGSEDIQVFSDGSIFEAKGRNVWPVSELVRSELRQGHGGDTTGCGDNFAGGLLGSVVNQLNSGRKQLDLKEALSWAVVSGGFACFYLGGTFFEDKPGEKLEKMKPYYESYKRQISTE